MTYEIDYLKAEHAGFSSILTVADRITVYVKLFSSGPARYFSGAQNGTIHKEITKVELDFWLNVLADNGDEISEINKKIALGKRY